jgi:hypothetical protein
MAKKPKNQPNEPLDSAVRQLDREVNLGALLSSAVVYQPFRVWLVGETPLIVHAWSQKAKLQMLEKQVKATKAGKDARDPHEDFVNSLYEMGEIKGKKAYGFPVTGIKNAALSSAHKDKGIARSVVQSALWFDADMVRVRPALAGAICDMPLVRVWGSDPEMREDMVRIGSGLNKTANLAYRGQFTTWAIRLTGKFNPTVLSPEALLFLIRESGVGIGIGEWRNEKKGIFGSYRLADIEEQNAWEKFAAGKGPLPVRKDEYQQAAE